VAFNARQKRAHRQKPEVRQRWREYMRNYRQANKVRSAGCNREGGAAAQHDETSDQQQLKLFDR
jgi:hypothetical protein